MEPKKEKIERTKANIRAGLLEWRAGLTDIRKKNPNLLSTLAEAQQRQRAYFYIEADYGGETFLTVPATRVACNEDTLINLAAELNSLSIWDVDSVRLEYREYDVGDNTGGGTGGGKITGKLWVNPSFRDGGEYQIAFGQKGLVRRIEKVLTGKNKSIFD